MNCLKKSLICTLYAVDTTMIHWHWWWSVSSWAIRKKQPCELWIGRKSLCTLETKQPHELWLARKLRFAHLKSNSPKNYKFLKNLLAHFISWDRKSFRFNTEIPLRLIDIQAQVVLIKWSFWWEVGSTVRLDGDSVLEVTGTQVCFNSNLI